MNTPGLSVLDRLLDDDPGCQGDERPLDDDEVVARLRSAVRRDLEWLLNTRVGWAPEYEPRDAHDGDPLEDTVVRYGLPDITTYNLKSERERQRLSRGIRDAIERFESRLEVWELETRPVDEARGRSSFLLRVRLRVKPEPLTLTFDASVVWKNRTVEVRSE